MSDPYKPNETAIEDALAKYRAGKVGLGGFPSYLFPPPSLPPVRKPVDPQFRIDRLRLHIRRLELEVEAARIDLQEAMFEAGQLGPARVEGKADNADTAIAALEPAPAEPEAEPVAPDVEIPEGFTKWEGGEWTGNPRAVVQVLFESGDIAGGSDVVEDRASWWTWTWDGTSDRIIAYRIISQPADQSEEGLGHALIGMGYGDDEPETHTDDLRTAEGETVAGDDRIETQSVTSDPDFVAAVERAEATLAIDAQTCEPIYPHPQPAYVGLQDPELDAEYEAMKQREEAAKPKPRFSIFGLVKEPA